MHSGHWGTVQKGTQETVSLGLSRLNGKDPPQLCVQLHQGRAQHWDAEPAMVTHALLTHPEISPEETQEACRQRQCSPRALPAQRGPFQPP